MDEIMNTYCLHCDKPVDAAIKKMNDSLSVRGRVIEYEADVLHCPHCGSLISDSRVESENLKAAYAVYGTEHRIPLPAEITELRERYGLSLREFSRFLGFGEQTVARYERGALPDEAHAYALRQAESIEGARSLLEANQAKLSERSVQKVEQFIERSRPSETVYATFPIPLLSLEARAPKTPCRANGYRVLDVGRVAGLAQLLAAKCTDLYKTKFQKAMFFCDMLACEQLGRSLTGLQYAHADFGPIIDGKDEVVCRLEHDGFLSSMEKGWGEVLEPGEAIAEAEFDDAELALIDQVANFVNSFSTAAEICEFSHTLDAWKSTKNGERIDYNVDPDGIGALMQVELYQDMKDCLQRKCTS